jgi:hypothetical protein
MSTISDNQPSVPLNTLPPISLSRFQELSGWSNTTLWRMRRKGWLQVIRICGRCYITPQAIVDFNRRAGLGEFAGRIPNPSITKTEDGETSKRIDRRQDAFSEQVARLKQHGA